jgi:sugar lactone lactonase YvrE
MKFLKRLFKFITISWLILTLVLVIIVRIRHGGGEYFEDRTADPILPASAIELVADLENPAGNIAVSDSGRIFFSFHPEAMPEIKVAELINGKPIPYPSLEFQKKQSGSPFFDTVLSLRIDRQNRLWTLDFAFHGVGQPRLLAFDLNTNTVVHQYDFPTEIAGLGSMLNDFQIDERGEKIYIAEASIFKLTPAIIVYDLNLKRARRLLENHPSVQAERFIPIVQGREMQVWGIFAIRPGVDSIALDKRGEWLYYAPVTNRNIYRIRTSDLNNESLTSADLASRVEVYAPKTMSDGITIDLEDNIYISDLEHSAVLQLGTDRKLKTLLKDDRLRWPDGFSFGPDNWLYLTCSSLHHVIFKSESHIRSQAPYQIFRFKPGPASVPGH